MKNINKNTNLEFKVDACYLSLNVKVTLLKKGVEWSFRDEI